MVERDLGQEEFVSRLLEIINSAVMMVGPDDRIELSNQKANIMFRLEADGAKGHTFQSLFMPDDREILYPNVIDLTLEHGEFEGEVMLMRPDGTSFIALLSTSLWPMEGGRRIVVTVHDITRLKSLERVLKKSERMAFLGRMLDDISHQIRNPVLAIGGFARRLSNMDSPRPEYLKVILDEAGRLELLLSTLTDFLRLPRPTPRPMGVRELWREIHQGDILNGGNGDVELSLSPPAQEAQAVIDHRLLLRAVGALMDNARESYEDGGGQGGVNPLVELKMDVHAQGPWACTVTVRDHGQGIRRHLLPHVFDPFFSTKTGHIGMGLTIAKRIVEEQGGELSVDSYAGQGTRAALKIPRDRRREFRVRRGADTNGARE